MANAQGRSLTRRPVRRSDRLISHCYETGESGTQSRVASRAKTSTSVSRRHAPSVQVIISNVKCQPPQVPFFLCLIESYQPLGTRAQPILFWDLETAGADAVVRYESGTALPFSSSYGTRSYISAVSVYSQNIDPTASSADGEEYRSSIAPITKTIRVFAKFPARNRSHYFQTPRVAQRVGASLANE